MCRRAVFFMGISHCHKSADFMIVEPVGMHHALKTRSKNTIIFRLYLAFAMQTEVLDAPDSSYWFGVLR